MALVRDEIMHAVATRLPYLHLKSNAALYFCGKEVDLGLTAEDVGTLGSEGPNVWIGVWAGQQRGAVDKARAARRGEHPSGRGEAGGLDRGVGPPVVTPAQSKLARINSKSAKMDGQTLARFVESLCARVFAALI